MNLIEKIELSRKQPKTYVEKTLPNITFTDKDDMDEIICLMMATAYQDMPDVFYKLVTLIESIPNLHENLDYMYYYHLSLASFYKHSGDHANAIEHCLRSNDVAYRLNYACGIVQSYRFLGSVYLNSKDYENASYYSTLAIKELNQCDDYGLAANVYSLYGVILVELEEYDYALQAYDNAFEVIKKLDDYEGDMIYYILHLNYGEALLLSDKVDLAEPYYLKAIDLSERYNHDYSFSELLIMLVDYYKRVGNYEKACYYYDKYFNKNKKASKVSELLNEKKDKEDIRKELSQLKHLRDTNQVFAKEIVSSSKNR